MGNSGIKLGFLFTFSFLAIALLFQNCELVGDKGGVKLEQGKGAASLNGTPYTGMQPVEGTYYALGVCAGSTEQSAVTRIDVQANSSSALLTDTCSNTTESVDVRDFFYRSYSENFFSYDSDIFEYF